MEVRMDADASLCVEVCRKDAETEFLEEFFSGVRIDVFEFQNPVLYFFLYAAVFEVPDVRHEVVHTAFASNQR